MSSDKRPSRDNVLMEVARVFSFRGTCTRAYVGAVLAQEGRVIASGYVGAPAGSRHCLDVGCEEGNHGGCTRTVHAESNAIAFAARYGVSTNKADLYTTTSPCNDCAKLIINAGIKRVIYHKAYRDPRGLRLLEETGVEVVKL